MEGAEDSTGDVSPYAWSEDEGVDASYQRRNANPDKSTNTRRKVSRKNKNTVQTSLLPEDRITSMGDDGQVLFDHAGGNLERLEVQINPSANGKP